MAQNAIAQFTESFQVNWLAGMRAKLGIFHADEQDETLVKELLKLMEKYQADYTNTFRALTFDKYKDLDLFNKAEFSQWVEL